MSFSRRAFAASLFSALAAAAAAPALAASDMMSRRASPCPPGVDPRVALCRGPGVGSGAGEQPHYRHPGQHGHDHHAGRGPLGDDRRWRQMDHDRRSRHPHDPVWRAPNGNPGPFPPMRRF